MSLPSPPHSLYVFAPRQARYALLVGVWNEGEKFTRQLAALQPYRDRFDILIADGGSADGATHPDALRPHCRALLVHTGQPRGLSAQYRMGLAFALKEGYDGVVMMDGNGKDGPAALPAFADALDEGCDFLQGSRFMPGGSHAHTPAKRVLGIRFVFNPLMQLASGFPYTDAINGFKGVSRRLLEDARLQPLRPVFVRYNLQYYLDYAAPRLGYRCREIPVSRRYEPATSAPQSKITTPAAYLSILRELLCTILGRYNP